MTAIRRVAEAALLALVAGMAGMVAMDVVSIAMAMQWMPLGDTWPYVLFWLGRALLFGFAIVGLARRSRDAAWASIGLLLLGVILLSPPMIYTTDHAPFRSALQGYGVVLLLALMWLPDFLVRKEAP